MDRYEYIDKLAGDLEDPYKLGLYLRLSIPSGITIELDRGFITMSLCKSMDRFDEKRTVGSDNEKSFRGYLWQGLRNDVSSKITTYRSRQNKEYLIQQLSINIFTKI